MLSLVFIGSTRRGFESLTALFDSGYHIKAVVSLTQSQHENERYESFFEEFTQKNHIPLFNNEALKPQSHAHQIIKEMAPDLFIVVGCRVLIGMDLFEKSRLGAVAVHDSLLPKYRGFAPLNWAIINGEKNTGVTLFFLTAEMDQGDIIAQEVFDIEDQEYAAEIYEKTIVATKKVLVKSLQQFDKNSLSLTKQDSTQATYCCSRAPEDGEINWNLSTTNIFNLVRGLSSPYPGAYTFYEDQKYIIEKAEVVDSDYQNYVGRIVGKIVKLNRNDGSVDILTATGALRILFLRNEKSELIAAANIINSVRKKLG